LTSIEIIAIGAIRIKSSLFKEHSDLVKACREVQSVKEKIEDVKEGEKVLKTYCESFNVNRYLVMTHE